MTLWSISRQRNRVGPHGRFKPFLKTSPAEWEKLIAVNLVGALFEEFRKGAANPDKLMEAFRRSIPLGRIKPDFRKPRSGG